MDCDEANAAIFSLDARGLVSFAAEERVDFRELLRELGGGASEGRTAPSGVRTSRLVVGGVPVVERSAAPPS